jgi:hypothetical protein
MAVLFGQPTDPEPDFGLFAEIVKNLALPSRL